jgi:hypothetical protein
MDASRASGHFFYLLPDLPDSFSLNFDGKYTWVMAVGLSFLSGAAAGGEGVLRWLGFSKHERCLAELNAGILRRLPPQWKRLSAKSQQGRGCRVGVAH